MRVKKNKKEKNTAMQFIEKRKRKSAKRFTLHFVFLGIFCLTSAIILSLTVFFCITTIEVMGNNRYSDKEVVQNSGIMLEDNLFRIDTKLAKAKILAKYPYFDEVYIRRKFPANVVIEVTMAKPAIAIETLEGYVLLSDKGKILQTKVEEADETLLRVRGLEKGKYIPGTFMEDNQSENYNMLKEFRKVAQTAELDNISYLDLSDRYNLKALCDNRILIEFGSEAKLEYKINFVKEMLAEKIPKDFGNDFEGVIDVSFDKQLRVRPMDLSELLDEQAIGDVKTVASEMISEKMQRGSTETVIYEKPIAIPIRENEQTAEETDNPKEKTEQSANESESETTDEDAAVFEYSKP